MSRPGPGPGQLGTAHWALLSPGRGPSCSTQAASLCPRVPVTSSHHHPHLRRVVDTVDSVDTGQTSRLRTRECSGGCRSRHKRAARSRPPFYYSAAPTQVHAATRHTALTHVPLTHLTLCRSAVDMEYHRRFCGGLAGGSKKSIYLRTTKSHNITRQRQRVFCVRYSTSKEIEKPQPQIRSDGDISAEDSGNASAGARWRQWRWGGHKAAGDDV